MWVLEIALGIILAYVVIKAAPSIFSVVLDTFARAVLVLANPLSLPPFWRNAANKRRGPNPVWVTAIICASLPVLAFLSAYLGT